MSIAVKETYAVIKGNKVFLSCPHCHIKMWTSIEKWEETLKAKYGYHIQDYDVFMNQEGNFNIKNKCSYCAKNYRVTGWEIEEVDV